MASPAFAPPMKLSMKLWSALLLAAAAGLLIACSGSDKTATPSAATSIAATAAASPSAASTVAPATPAAAPAATPADYSNAANWLCRPGKSPTPCTVDLNATAKAADGSLKPDPFVAAANPAVDCFYVYPTVSTDAGANSDLVPGSEEANVATQQFARLGSVCRLYAPVYRQITVRAITSAIASLTPIDAKVTGLAYGDVLASWKWYLEHDNQGRGVILVGHSQGSGHLIKLIKDEIDPSPAARAKLVSAFIIGSGVKVPAGADVGGDFQNVPACRKPEQNGCVVAYSTFSADSPPPANSFFGLGGVLCVNPAALSGGPADLHPYNSSAANVVTGVTTPFVTFPGQLRGECVNTNGASYLKLTPSATFSLPPFLISAQWGLHLIDVNAAMGDIVSLAAKQIAAYSAR